MRTMNSVLLILLMTSLAGTQALAKRGAPKDVPPVTANGVTYSAPHDHMGCVIAKDEKTGRILWNKQIYVVKYDPELEKDVQDCFITELKIAGDKLTVRDERDGEFELNLTTLAVKALKGAELIEKRK